MLRSLQLVTLAAVVMALTPLPAQTSPTPPKVELFGGFSLLHVPTESPGRKANFSGWNGSVSVYVRPWLGLVTDVSGNYKSDTLGTIDINTNTYNASFGPQFKYRASRAEPFAHAMFGYTRTSAGVSSLPTITFTSNGLALIMGGGLDMRISKRLAVRLGQADYVLNHITTSGVNVNNFRFSTGLVVRF